MTANVQFLNVGWGDAHLIQLPSGAVTLIDGGDGRTADGQDHPLHWMNRNGIGQLDWMILTHIHEDHINGLLDIAKHKKVVKAVLPYKPFELPSEELVQAYENDRIVNIFNMLNSYLELVHILKEQGTEIQWRHAFASADRSVVWAEEGFVLAHLYPWEGDPLPAFDMLVQAVDNLEPPSIDRMGGALDRFFDLSNHDCSVYRLSAEQDSNESILFGGDQLEPGWERLARRVSVKSRVWKVSHHGMKDGFNDRVLSWIQPEHCVIPISADRSPLLQAHWDELRSSTAASFHITGSVPIGETRRIYQGDFINVQVGY